MHEFKRLDCRTVCRQGQRQTNLLELRRGGIGEAEQMSQIGVWRQEANSQSPPLAGHSASAWTFSLSARLPGWRRSADRTGLRANSLLTGNFTGKIAIPRLLETILEQETAVPRRLFAQFPMQINRENISINREFVSGNRELEPQNRLSIFRLRPFLLAEEPTLP